jgi:hypothetical protein
MQRHFYATRDDLLPVFDTFESKHRVAFTLTGLRESPSPTMVQSGSAIATLGHPATISSASSGYQYLITPAGQSVAVREVPQTAGGIRYAIDQLANPISIVFQHGGFYASDILLYGRVGTCSEHPTATKLYRAFASAVAKHFSRIQAFYVGQEAKGFLDGGCRLTIGAHSPRECDLAYERPTNVA